MQKNKPDIGLGLIITKTLIFCFFMFPIRLIANEEINFNKPENDIKTWSERQMSSKNRRLIESLTGTWFFSYTLGTSSPTSYTDRIILDDVAVSSSGDFKIAGLYYENTNTAGQNIECKQNQPEIFSLFNTEFICLTSTNNLSFYQAFIFSFTENTITKGFYGQGSTVLNAISHVSNGITPMSGNRESERVLTIDETKVVYNAVKGELVIPLVKYSNDYYSVVLQHKGKFVFTLKNASTIVPEPGVIIENIYDDGMDDLILSNLKYNGQNYYVILHNQGDFVFSLLSAELLK